MKKKNIPFHFFFYSVQYMAQLQTNKWKAKLTKVVQKNFSQESCPLSTCYHSSVVIVKIYGSIVSGFAGKEAETYPSSFQKG